MFSKRILGGRLLACRLSTEAINDNLNVKFFDEYVKSVEKVGFKAEEEPEEMTDEKRIYMSKIKDNAFYCSLKVKRLCEEGKYDDAYKFFKGGLQYRKFLLDPAPFNTLINCLGKVGRATKAYDIFLEMKRRAIKRDEFTYIAIINSYAMAAESDALKNYGEKEKVFEKYMETCKHLYAEFCSMPDYYNGKLATSVFNCLLKACRSIGTIKDLYEIFPPEASDSADQIKADVITFSLASETALRLGHSQLCSKYLTRMLEQKINPDIFFLHGMLNGYYSFVKAMPPSMLEDQKQNIIRFIYKTFSFFCLHAKKPFPQIVPNALTFTIIIKFFRDIGEYEQALKFYKATRSQIFKLIRKAEGTPDMILVRVLYSVLCKKVKQDDILDLTNLLEKKNVPLDIHAVIAILSWYVGKKQKTFVLSVMDTFFGYKSDHITTLKFPFKYIKPKQLFAPTLNVVYALLPSLTSNQTRMFFNWLKINFPDTYKEASKLDKSKK